MPDNIINIPPQEPEESASFFRSLCGSFLGCINDGMASFGASFFVSVAEAVLAGGCGFLGAYILKQKYQEYDEFRVIAESSALGAGIIAIPVSCLLDLCTQNTNNPLPLYLAVSLAITVAAGPVASAVLPIELTKGIAINTFFNATTTGAAIISTAGLGIYAASVCVKNNLL